MNNPLHRMSSRVQNLLMILGIVLIAALGYYLMTQRSATGLQGSMPNSQIAAESSTFLRRLNDLKSITLDGSVFSNPRFRILVDFSEPITPEPVGRTNPFTTN